MVGKITYQYTPSDWSQDAFLAYGGFTVVFLNYNKMAQIQKSVASTLAQDFPMLEMFFMDDASTDGSGDEMESLVRVYQGRHKVSVVRNSENQRITGQWNIVAKVATGNWFGMFCGDDIQYVNRVSLVAERIKKYPKLKGICTAVVKRDYNDGEKLSRIHYGLKPWEMTGEVNDPSEIENVIDGASSFWHRSLFDRPFPRVNLDDMLIRWVLQAKSEGVEDVVWTWASDLVTLEYSAGTGITSRDVNKGRKGNNCVSKWVLNTRQIKSWGALVMLSHRGIDEYFDDIGASPKLKAMSRYSGLRAAICAGNTISRLALFPDVIGMIVSKHVSKRSKFLLVSFFAKKLVQEFFGEYFAACGSCVWRSCFKREKVVV